MIHIIRTRATQQQMSEMLEILGTYVKLAVDIQRRMLAGGGAMHADCEAVLLEVGARGEAPGPRLCERGARFGGAAKGLRLG